MPLDKVAECARRCVAVEGTPGLWPGNSVSALRGAKDHLQILAAQGVEADLTGDFDFRLSAGA